jgi:ribonuclease-3 family protein
MLFSQQEALPEATVKVMSPRILAHVGDAVFHLYEREREILQAVKASQVHDRAALRASANGQADLLDIIAEHLTEPEADIVRRARNVKPLRQRRTDQATYRKATAFEALLGYLYMTNRARLRELLELTLG